MKTLCKRFKKHINNCDMLTCKEWYEHDHLSDCKCCYSWTIGVNLD